MRTKLNRRERKAIKKYFGFDRLMKKNNNWYYLDYSKSNNYLEGSYYIEVAEDNNII